MSTPLTPKQTSDNLHLARGELRQAGHRRWLRQRGDDRHEARSPDLLPDAIEMALQSGDSLGKPAFLATDVDQDVLECGFEQHASIAFFRLRRAPVITREADQP